MLKRIFLVFSLLWLPAEMYAQAPLLWEMQEDIYGSLDAAGPITLSGNAAVVVGQSFDPQEGTWDLAPVRK